MEKEEIIRRFREGEVELQDFEKDNRDEPLHCCWSACHRYNEPETQLWNCGKMILCSEHLVEFMLEAEKLELERKAWTRKRYQEGDEVIFDYHPDVHDLNLEKYDGEVGVVIFGGTERIGVEFEREGMMDDLWFLFIEYLTKKEEDSHA